jgi:hypothetical protein
MYVSRHEGLLTTAMAFNVDSILCGASYITTAHLLAHTLSIAFSLHSKGRKSFGIRVVCDMRAADDCDQGQVLVKTSQTCVCGQHRQFAMKSIHCLTWRFVHVSSTV